MSKTTIAAVSALAMLGIACERSLETGDTFASGGTPAVSATDQSNAPADLQVTQEIRQALLARDSLSTAAKNVTVVTESGRVTVRGSLPSEAERTVVTGIAQELARGRQVDDQIRVVAN